MSAHVHSIFSEFPSPANSPRTRDVISAILPPIVLWYNHGEIIEFIKSQFCFEISCVNLCLTVLSASQTQDLWWSCHRVRKWHSTPPWGGQWGVRMRCNWSIGTPESVNLSASGCAIRHYVITMCRENLLMPIGTLRLWLLTNERLGKWPQTQVPGSEVSSLHRMSRPY